MSSQKGTTDSGDARSGCYELPVPHPIDALEASEIDGTCPARTPQVTTITTMASDSEKHSYAGTRL